MSPVGKMQGQSTLVKDSCYQRKKKNTADIVLEKLNFYKVYPKSNVDFVPSVLKTLLGPHGSVEGMTGAGG